MDLAAVFWAVVGIGLFILVGIPIISGVIVVVLTAIALTFALVGSMALYVVGMPVAVWRRVRDGVW